MKRKIIIWIIVIIFLLPLWMFLSWVFSSSRKLDVLILDKTSLSNNYDEHRSFNWILNNQKFTKRDGNLYEIGKDYFGFYPEDSYVYKTKDFTTVSDKQLDSMADYYDMTYYTDVYGVYSREWYGTKDNKDQANSLKMFNVLKMMQGKQAAGERSQLIYGGLSYGDVLFLEKMKQRKKLILTEFNFLGSPSDDKIREKAEEDFGIHWTGWIGRYFDNLDTLKNRELPKWVVSLYKQQHAGKWPFKNSGIVFVNRNETIAVLEQDTHLKKDVPVIETNEHFQDMYNIPDKVIYPFWFDITVNTRDNDIISAYHIYTNNTGDSVLKYHGIPKGFPAAMSHYKDDYKFFYFSGDFADNQINATAISKLKGIKYFRTFLYNHGELGDRNRFFWSYYCQMMSTILNNYYDTYKKK